MLKVGDKVRFIKQSKYASFCIPDEIGTVTRVFKLDYVRVRYSSDKFYWTHDSDQLKLIDSKIVCGG